jgi:WD40 repeat protein
VPCLAFDPTGGRLVSGSKDRQIKFWSPATGVEQGGVVLPGKVQSVAFTEDGGLLAVAYWESDGRGIALVDCATQQLLGSAAHSLRWIYALQLLERDGDLYLAAAGSAGVALWQVTQLAETTADGRHPLRLTPVVQPYVKRSIHIAVSPNSRWMAWVYEDSAIDLWDIGAARRRPLQTPPLNQGWHGLVFFPDNRRLAFVTDRGVVDLWDIVDDKKTLQLGVPGELIAPHIALSRDGRWLAGVVAPIAIGVWDTSNGKRLFVLPSERSSIWSLAWSPHRDLLAVGLSDGGIGLWSIERIRAELAKLQLDWRGQTAGGAHRDRETIDRP